MNDTTIELTIAGVTMGTLLSTMMGVVYWVQKTKVSKDTCGVVRQADRNEHRNLQQYIKDAESRAETRHNELKDDLKVIRETIERIR